jgi:hypothetical protein
VHIPSFASTLTKLGALFKNRDDPELHTVAEATKGAGE